MGREDEALAQARANIDAWTAIEGLDAIVINTSGCGTTVKDYGFMLRTDPAYAERAARVSSLAKDIAEYLGRRAAQSRGTHARARRRLPFSLFAAARQHVARQPKKILAKLGFVVKDVPEGHLCCGSAGTYNILQARYRKEVARAQSQDYREIAT